MKRSSPFTWVIWCATPAADSPHRSTASSRRIADAISERGAENEPTAWFDFTRPDRLEEFLAGIHDDVIAEYRRRVERAGIRFVQDPHALLTDILDRESRAAGILSYLNRAGTPESIMAMLRSERLRPGLTDVSWFLGQVQPARGFVGSGRIVFAVTSPKAL